MNASKFFLKAANSLITAIVALFLILAAAYSGYALWDNAQVYGAVDDIQSQLLKLKPDPEQKDGGASFEELRKINPDVCGWITLDHTKIDYPILQGEDNLTYINTDVYGDFALSGSIFLDSGCDRNFQGKYSLLYGHHMAEHKMFGDLDLYRKKKFFNKNTTGTLILPDRSYKLEIFACMQVSASEDSIFGKMAGGYQWTCGFCQKKRRTCPSADDGQYWKVRRFFPDTGNVNLLFGIYRCKNSSSGGNETLFAGDVRRG